VRVRACSASFAAALALLLLGAQSAAATFHEMMIREVYPGSVAHPDSEYVELQMWALGQNFVGGHQIGFFDASGASVGTATFSHDVSGDANQSTLVAATPEAESDFGFSADAAFTPGLLDPVGGAVCWESLDCVAWGNFTGSAKSPVGPAAAAGGIPDGMALRRTIEPGCATLLEPGDDHDNSAADFSLVFPGPRPNSVTPSERPCSPQTAAGGNANPEGVSTGAGKRRPQTSLRLRPRHKTRDRTPTFSFKSSVVDSTYLCKLDGAGFKACRPPFTAHRLGLGLHVFKVKARAPDGAADRSPAIYRFTVVKPRRARGD
jgi:hypothetical protein